jgi:hypothetical protein
VTRREVQVFGALGAVAALVALLVPTYPNYDSYYALVWGREVLHGVKPSFEAYAAPTEHPLWIAWCAVLDLLFGGVADRALVVSAVLSFVGLVWGVYRVGRTSFGPLSGALAAIFTGSSFGFILYAARGYVDVPFLALIVWAGALEAMRPRRGLSVQVLLAVAGLLRPEAWVLAGAYWLWLDPRRAGVRGVVLLVIAPVLWAVVDKLVTGDFLYSLHATNALASDLGRERGIVHVPRAFVSFLADTARPPVFVAGLAGLVLAWRRRAELRSLHVPYALFGGGVITFIGTGIVGLSILPRYLTVPTVALCLFGGYAVAGFERLPAGRVRDWWQRGAAGAIVIGVVFLVIKLPSFTALTSELRFIHKTHTDLVAFLDDPAVRAGERCGPLAYPTYRLIPDTRFELGDHEPGQHRVVSRAVDRGRAGVDVFLVGKKPISRFGHADGVSRRTNDDVPSRAPDARHGMLIGFSGACAAARSR